MSRLLLLAVIVVLVGPLFSSCGPAVPSPAAEVSAPPTAKAPAAVSRAAWEVEWERVQADARKEGKLLVYGSGTGGLRDIGMFKHFKDRFGIDVENIAGSASELLPKIQAERRAGLYLGDAFIVSLGTLLNSMKPAGLTDSLDSVLFLPEVMDPTAWYKGELPWVDKEHHQVAMLAMPIGAVTINTDLVKPDEIKSYRDLLSPKWKGKIALVDPSQSGQGGTWFSAMAGGIMDLDYLREFARQDLQISRNDRLMAEWIAKGRVSVIVALKTDLVAEFQRLGAPIKGIPMAEGTYVATDSAGLVLMNNAPHPNARKVFTNWILTKEGGTFVSRAWGGQHARVDVPTDFIDPLQVRQPGVKYFDDNNEEHALKKPGYWKLAAEVFAASLK
ncbi:MAG: extracellular solute-binding protein [Chloroflexi bacterium]|nr:extracellular solute-binding protein [Chloroflexota bacterium]